MNVAICKKIISAALYPFGHKEGMYRIIKPRKNKRAHSEKELIQLIGFKPETENDRFGHDMWLFIFYANGINMSDILRLQFKNRIGDFFYFYRHKTKRTTNEPKQISFLITPEIQRIIHAWGNKDQDPESYVFPFVDWSQSYRVCRNQIDLVLRKTNNAMKKIARQLELDIHPTTYSARHSFGTLLMKKGVPLPYISECYGHSSLAITQDYLGDFTEDERKEYANKLLELTRV